MALHNRASRNGGASHLLPILLPLAILILWIYATSAGHIAPYLIPSPQTVLASARTYISPSAAHLNTPYSGRFMQDLTASLLRVFLGFSLAVLCGLPCGILSGRIPCLKQLLSGPINAMRAVPGITLLPLALVWFGIGLKTTIFLVGLAAFFPIYLNTLAGTEQVPSVFLQAGAMMGAGRFRLLVSVLIPAAMPHIVTGLRLGLGIAWAYLVLGEMSGVSYGLGAVIMDARMLGRTDMIIVGIILIASIGQLSDLILQLILRKWQGYSENEERG